VEAAIQARGGEDLREGISVLVGDLLLMRWRSDLAGQGNPDDKFKYLICRLEDYGEGEALEVELTGKYGAARIARR
jgi:hypothetical protein